MTIKLYGMTISPYTRHVLIVLYELNIPFENVVVSLATGDQKSPEHIARQPFGKIPVLEDDGFLIFESRAICKYLVKKYGKGTKLIPGDEDLKAYAMYEQGCSMEVSYFDRPTTILAVEQLFKSFRGLGPDEDVVAKQSAALETGLVGYEKILSKQAYIAGDELTLADLFHIPYGSIAMKQIGYADLFAKYPAVNKWLEGLLQRESWAKASK